MKEKRILLLVDMQEGFLRFKEASNLLNSVSNVLPYFDDVLATKYENSKGSFFETVLGWSGMQSREDQELVKVAKDNASFVLSKQWYSCKGSDLIPHLKRMNNGVVPKEVWVAGVDTDCCVLAVAVELFESGVKPIIIKDCCWSSGGEEYHTAGLMCLRRLIGKNQIVFSLDIM